MTSETSSVTMFLVTAFYLAVSAAVFSLVNSVQPDPYMDEIFHVPQARKYCNGKFTEVMMSKFERLKMNQKMLNLKIPAKTDSVGSCSSHA